MSQSLHCALYQHFPWFQSLCCRKKWTGLIAPICGLTNLCHRFCLNFLLSCIFLRRESSHSVQVSYLKDISTHLDTLSTLCSSMRKKCQHRRIQQVRIVSGTRHNTTANLLGTLIILNSQGHTATTGRNITSYSILLATSSILIISYAVVEFDSHRFGGHMLTRQADFAKQQVLPWSWSHCSCPRVGKAVAGLEFINSPEKSDVIAVPMRTVTITVPSTILH